MLMIARATKVLTLCCMMTIGCAARPRAELQRLEFNQPHMGVQVRVVMFAEDSARAESAAKAAYREIERLESIMSDYRDDSEVALLGRQSGRAPLPISRDLFAVLDHAREISAASDGAFDVTIGPVTLLWRQAAASGEAPTAAEIEHARQLVNWRDLILDPERQTALLARNGMRIDLGGIGQGYAGDGALDILRRHGITRCLVDVSGDIAIGDPPPGAPGWTIAVTTRHTTATRVLKLRNTGISTSGSSGRMYEVRGERRSHIIDPRQSDDHGPAPSRMATVIAQRCATADALATALCILDPATAIELVESMPDAAALIVDERGATMTSRAFQTLTEADD